MWNRRSSSKSSSRCDHVVRRRRSQPMDVPLCETQEFADRFGQALPPGLLLGEPLLTGFGQPVDPRPPIVFRHQPFGPDPAEMLHAVKRRIERAFFNPQHVVGDQLNVSRDTVSVLRTPSERREHQQIESSLKGVLFATSQHSHYPRTLGNDESAVKQVPFQPCTVRLLDSLMPRTRTRRTSVRKAPSRGTEGALNVRSRGEVCVMVCESRTKEVACRCPVALFSGRPVPPASVYCRVISSPVAVAKPLRRRRQPSPVKEPRRDARSRSAPTKTRTGQARPPSTRRGACSRSEERRVGGERR